MINELTEFRLEDTATVKRNIGAEYGADGSTAGELRIKVWERVMREILGEDVYNTLVDFVNKEVELEKRLREFRGRS